MANLENCTVTSFTSEEIQGDNFLDGTMTVQTVDGAPLANKKYKLFVSSNWEHEVQASYLTIGGLEPSGIFTNGGRYWVGNNFPDDLEVVVQQITIRDLGTVGSPDNIVEVEILMHNTFVFPGGDYTLDIDIDGDAEIYTPPNISDYNISASLTKITGGSNIDIKVFSSTLVNQLDMTGAWPCAGILNTACTMYNPCSPTYQWADAAYIGGDFNPNDFITGETDSNDQNIYDNLTTDNCTTYEFSVDSNSGGDVLALVVGTDIPSSLKWRLRCTDGGSIQALSSFINVYYSLTHYEDTNGDVQLIPYTSSNNLSAVDLGSMTLTQDDCENVTVEIPFNTNFNWPTHVDGTEIGKVYIKNLFSAYAAPPAAEDAECQPEPGDEDFMQNVP